ncbi:MAG: elongation factor P [Spirochaetales bacterium]|nr:elongation factor P [Spirochaetales bacterium]MBR2317797.1 elongation factor P [Spirochaetales bacterium]
MLINVQDIRKGNVFKENGDLWTVMFFQHVTPGKGGAFVKVKARNMKTGNQKENNYRSGEKIELVDVFEKDGTYTYKDGDNFVFMDSETFEQYEVPAEMCEDVEKFVLENGNVKLSIYEGTVLSVSPENFVQLRVKHSDPGVKGDTVTKTTKSVEIETGATIQVPLFIQEGDLLKIDTRTGEYLERINEKK